jgi:hypothetical protein
MAITLDEVIVKNRELLVDWVVKDAIRQIPSYGQAPLRQTIERAERWLDTLATSVEQNDPDVLESCLVGVAGERRREGYAIMELHGIVQIDRAEKERRSKVVGHRDCRSVSRAKGDSACTRRI